MDHWDAKFGDLKIKTGKCKKKKLLKTRGK